MRPRSRTKPDVVRRSSNRAKPSGVEAHDGEGGRSTVRIGRVRLVGCGEPEPQEGHAMAGRGSRESCGVRRDLRWLPEFASESGSGTLQNTQRKNARPQLTTR